MNNNTEAAKASFAFSITIKGLDVLVPGPKMEDIMSAKLEEFKLDLLIESATPATVYEAVGGIVETVCKTVMTMQKEDPNLLDWEDDLYAEQGSKPGEARPAYYVKEENNMRKIIVWADYTWTDAEDFDYEKDWSWMSDDYMEIEVPEDLNDDDIEQWLKDREKRPKQYLYCNHRLVATVTSLAHAIDHMFKHEGMMDSLQFELQDDGTRCMITPWSEESMEVIYLLSDTDNLGHIGEGN